jgi:hypothetical protein
LRPIRARARYSQEKDIDILQVASWQFETFYLLMHERIN